MADEEDKVDDFLRKIFFKGFTYREICLFTQRNHECIFSITPSEKENQQLGLLRRMLL